MAIFGRITRFQGEYRWLSNFWPATVSMTTRVYDDAWGSTGTPVARTFRTAEAAYQASKFDGREWDQFAILPGSQDGAREAKRIGKRRQHVNVERKIECMRLVIASKFSTANPGLLKALLETDGLVIEEGNQWGDRFWGIAPPASGEGQNWLGRIIMDRRSFLLSNGFKPGVLYSQTVSNGFIADPTPYLERHKAKEITEVVRYHR